MLMVLVLEGGNLGIESLLDTFQNLPSLSRVDGLLDIPIGDV